MFKKIIFFFAWIGIFSLSLIGINLILLPGELIFSPEIINPEKITPFDLKMVLLVICILYIFICIFKFISLFERKKEYIKKTENGIIKISNTTINSYVSELLKKDNEIGNIKVSSNGKAKNFFINIKLQILQQLNIEEKINEVQNRVKENLNESLGIEVKDVLINITNISTKENIKKNKEN